MAIYKGTNVLKAFKGDAHPVNIYKGSSKIAGWKFSEVSSESLSVTNTYNDECAITINGKSTQVQTVQGKNLLDVKSGASNIGGTTVSVANELISISGTVVGGHYVKLTRNYVTALDTAGEIAWCLEGQLFPAGIYTLSWGNKNISTTSSFYPIIVVLFTDGTYLSLRQDRASITITEGKIISNIAYFAGTIGATISGSFNLQLELGSTATPYVPFAPDSPSPLYPSTINSVSNFNLVSTNGADKIQNVNLPYNLRSLPNGVCDQIIIDNIAKTAKLVQNVGELVLDNNAGWELQGIANGITAITLYFNTGNIGATSGTPSYCSHLPYQQSTAVVCHYVQSSDLYVRVLQSAFPDLATFTTWLSTNPMTVQYQLEIPVITILNYEAIKTYYPQTQLSTNATVKPMLNGKFRVIE